MTVPVRALVCVLIVCGFSARAISDSVAQSTEDTVGLSEASMRWAGVVAPAPDCPHPSLERKSAGVAVAARASPVLLDVGEREAFKRGHLAGAINIPVDELTVRARMELDPKKPHVIDCTQEERPRCDRAVATLRRAGFSDLMLLVR